MKGLKLSLWIVGFLTLCHSALAQTATKHYHVTIGVFAVQNNAINYTAKANKQGFNSQYAINPIRKLYYVYLLQTEDRKKAYAFVTKLKVETDYKDAWVYEGALGETPAEVQKQPVIEKPVIEEPVNEPIKEPVVIIEETKPVKIDSSTIVKPVVKKVAKGKFFVFRFLNTETGNDVRGELHLAESQRATQYQSFKANELVDVPSPRNTEKVFFLTTVAPGYKALETVINFKDPAPSSSGMGPDGEFIVPLTLSRAKRGDYIEFNNVSFYRNSVIMQPQFKDELDGLADLMKENVKYKVRIHGHCNGMEARDIITLGTSVKYFESDPANVKKSGSAKELTELRAETARRYLVSQGIAVERILTKGEGGKMMVYPQTSVYANYNDRIEVEVLRH